MCEYVSVIATTKGSLQLYAAPGLCTHGDARVGWNIVGGAEVEWTGEHHDTLTVRHEDKSVRKTVLQMIKDKYPTRTDLINSITETRGVGKSKLYYKNGKVVYKKETHGSKYKEVKKFIQDLHTFPWFKPVPNLDKEKIVALVQEHITVLGKYGYKKNKISVKFVNTWGAARDNDWNTAYNAAYNAAFVATYDAARSAMYYDDCDVTWGTARSVIYYDGWDAAWGVAYNVARTVAVYAPWDAAREAIWCADKYAACLVADVDNPFSSYVEIYRLGCVPVGVVGKKFVVCIPPTKNP